MASCKDCIHYDICCFHLKGNENERCVQFLPTADVVPKSEVAREIFEELHQKRNELWNKGKYTMFETWCKAEEELKKKYTEIENG